MFRSKLKLLLLTSIVLFLTLTLTSAISAESIISLDGDNKNQPLPIYKSPSDSICDCLPGDANGDFGVNIGDAVYLINYVFKHGPGPTPYDICSGDYNGDCAVNIQDVVRFVCWYVNGWGFLCHPVTCEEWVANCGEIH